MAGPPEGLIMAATTSKSRKGAAVASYLVQMVRQSFPDDRCAVVVRAQDADTARRLAAERFPDHRVLKARKDDGRHKVDAYPDARFIKGQFLSQTFSDEPVLLALGK